MCKDTELSSVQCNKTKQYKQFSSCGGGADKRNISENHQDLVSIHLLQKGEMYILRGRLEKKKQEKTWSKAWRWGHAFVSG